HACAVGNLLYINYPSSHDVSFAYDALNRVSTMVDGVGTTVYTYTTGNQLLTEDGPFASDTVIHPVRNFRMQRKRPLRSVSPICSRVSPARSFSHGAGTYVNRLRIGLALQQPTGFWPTASATMRPDV